MTTGVASSSLQTHENVSLEDVLAAMPQPLSPTAEEKIRCAYEIADRSHKNVKRVSGSPYIEHPLNVALILAQLGMDEDTVCAGLLHDAIEDSKLWIEYLSAACGLDVCHLVDGLTKIGSLHVSSAQESQMENLRRMLLFTAQDIRVIVVKLADRLHNMRTLKHLPPDKQKRIAQVTLDIYAPLAHLIGIGRIKMELEDLALSYLQPKVYEDIKSWVAAKRSEREGILETFRSKLETMLTQRGIPAQVEGRAKHFYSIYNKMRKTGRDLRQLYDLLAVRVITNTVENCYVVLGLVHQLCRPIEGRLKDYIAMAKPNGYQSLHTTVRDEQGREIEVQIRTHEMHLIAEEGVAAHWRYKLQGHSRRNELDHMRVMGQIKKLLHETEETNNPDEFFDTLRTDLLSEDEIYVYTPKGDIVRLPKDATPIDFAYQIHSEIGDRFCGARVDGKFVGQNYQLKTGQRVEIVTSPRARPSPDWLSVVKTARARSKIKRALLQDQRERLMGMGRAALLRELQRAGLHPQETLHSAELRELCKRYNVAGVDDLMVAIGFGRLSTKQIISKLVRPERAKTRTPRNVPSTAISLRQMDDLLYRRARCCNPVPGEPITGIVTVARGISIHRSSCTNITGFRGDSNRLIPLTWDTTGTERFDVVIDIGAKDRAALLSDISGIISAGGINITSCKTVSKGGLASLVFTLEVNDIDQLQRVMERLESVQGVQSVLRRRRQPPERNGKPAAKSSKKASKPGRR